MATGSYAARIIDAVRKGLAATDDLDAIADQIDMDAETVRNVVDVLTYTPHLVALVESGDMRLYAAYQEAKKVKKLQERAAGQTQKQVRNNTKVRNKFRREAEAITTKQTDVRNKEKPRQRPLTIGDRRLIWLCNLALGMNRIGRCLACECDASQPDARCAGIVRVGEDDLREVSAVVLRGTVFI
jgi:hypothetical protein